MILASALNKGLSINQEHLHTHLVCGYYGYKKITQQFKLLRTEDGQSLTEGNFWHELKLSMG